MEKQGKFKPKNKIFPSSQVYNQQQEQHQNSKVSKLGGIHLYNQDYKRHICSKSGQSNQKGNITGTGLDQIMKNEQDQLFISHEIADFLEHRQKHKFNMNSISTLQIQKIIHNFKNSHHSTNRFLVEHQNKNDQMDNMNLFSFQELFQSQKNKNKLKYTILMEKISAHFRETVLKQIEKLRLEQQSKIKTKQILKKQYATQTVLIHDNDLTLIKQQLQRKEAEYNALYQYKKDVINDSANMVKGLEVKCQYQQSLIKKMQNQNVSKNLQIRNLQTTLKKTQDRLFNRILELQKMYESSQARLSLSSIKQMPNSYDILKQNEILSNFIAKLNSKKKRYKQRAESILSVTHSIFSNLRDKDDIAVSMAEIAAKSMREIDIHYDKEIDTDYIEELRKISKNSIEGQHLFKILQVYKNTKKRNSQQKNGKNIKNKIAIISKSPDRNSSLLASKVDRQSLNRGSFRQQVAKSRVNSRQKREKVEDVKNTPKKNSKKIQTIKDQNKPKASIINKQTFDRRISTPLQQTFFSSPKNEKSSIFKVSIKQIPLAPTKVEEKNIESHSQLDQSRKKLKKGVCFRIESNPHLQLHSLEINICINNHSNTLNASKQPTLQNISSGETMNEKMSDSGLQNFDKCRFSKNKLMKTKVKQQMHKKIGSTQIESHRMSTMGFNTNNQKTMLFHNATASSFYKPLFNNQKQRFSCHTSQEKINPFDNNDQRSKPRNSFSRLQQSSLSHHPQNEKEMRIVKQMAAKCRNKSQYQQKIMKLHKGCGQNCQHIKRYLQYFDKLKQQHKKQNLKLNIQDLNNNLRSPLPTIKYDK